MFRGRRWVLVSAFALFFTSFIASSSVEAASSNRFVPFCSFVDSTYAAGEFIVTYKDIHHRFNSKMSEARYKANKNLLRKHLSRQVAAGHIVNIEDVYVPDYKHLPKIDIFKMFSKPSAKERKMQNFAKKIADSAIPRTVVLKTDYTSCKDMENFSRKLYRNRNIEHIAVNKIFNNSTFTGLGSPTDPLYATEQAYLSAANVWKAWSTSTGENSVIGILDYSLMVNHPDLHDSILVNSNEIPNNGIDDDNNGCVDDVYGCDPVYEDGILLAQDYMTHGTLVAGVAAAGANNDGMVGVAPNSKIVFSSYTYSRDTDKGFRLNKKSDIIRGLQYLISRGVDVVNLSLGAYYPGVDLPQIPADALYLELRKIIESGIPVVAAAGNENVSLTGADEVVHDTKGTLCRGNCFDYFSQVPGVILVGSSSLVGRKSSFSNYGEDMDIVAPGESITSTTFEVVDYAQGLITPSYRTTQGTSLSAPIVSGIISLIHSISPNLGVEIITEILKSTGKKVTLSSSEIAAGVKMGPLVDAQAAVNFTEKLNSIQRPGTIYFDWAEHKEYWLRSDDLGWLYILPNGKLYQWTSSSTELGQHDKLLLDIGPSLYQHPDLLPGISENDALNIHNQIISAVASVNYTGNLHYNWSGNREIWFKNNNKDWVYLLPSGELYLHDSGSKEGMIVIDSLLANLGYEYYNDISLFAGIKKEVADGFFNSVVGDIITSGNTYFDWAGRQEKWLKKGSKWLYILPNGKLYQAKGGAEGVRNNTNELIIQLPTDYYDDITLFPGIN